MNVKVISALAISAALLAGCTSMNVFKDSPEPQAKATQPDLAPEDTIDEPVVAKPSGPKVLTAQEIRNAITGKSWKRVGTKYTSVTLYFGDGSALIEIVGVGNTKGKWMAKDGQLCESISANEVWKQEVEMTCRPITGSGNNYKVGNAAFTLA